MAEFTSLREATKFAKVGGLSELLVPPVYIKFISFDKVEVTIGYFNVGGKTEQKKLQLNLPPYLFPIISRLFTRRSTTYSLLTSLTNDLAIKCLNDIFSKYTENVYLSYSNNIIRCMVPEKYTFLPNEYILNSMINKDSEDNIVNILMCDQTRVMRMVYTHGDQIKTQAGMIKKAVAILNSEIGMLDYKTIKKSSVVAYPTIWYSDINKCTILNGQDIPFTAINQLNQKRNDILLDFVVDIEMRKLHETVTDIHSKMLQERPNEKLISMVRVAFKTIDPPYYKAMSKMIETMSTYDLYVNILNRSSSYTPQFRVKIEKICGQIYGGFYDKL